jgi:hypothetical protein
MTIVLRTPRLLLREWRDTDRELQYPLTQVMSTHRGLRIPTMSTQRPKSISQLTCMGLSPVNGLFLAVGHLIADCLFGFC